MVKAMIEARLAARCSEAGGGADVPDRDVEEADDQQRPDLAARDAEALSRQFGRSERTRPRRRRGRCVRKVQTGTSVTARFITGQLTPQSTVRTASNRSPAPTLSRPALGDILAFAPARGSWRRPRYVDGLPPLVDAPEHLLALGRQHDHPVADFVDVAQAADAQARLVIEATDADAGRRRSARQQTLALRAAALAIEKASGRCVVHGSGISQIVGQGVTETARIQSALSITMPDGIAPPSFCGPRDGTGKHD